MLTAFYDKVALKVEYEGQVGSRVLCSVTELGSLQGAFSVINGVMISKIDDELCRFGGGT